jgi:hypothetical protein
MTQDTRDKLIERYREALLPFASFVEHAVDDEGWIGQSGNERINDWFGPSDFRNARKALDDGGEK